MKHQEINKDPFIKSVLDEGGLEQPSSEFTNQIINKLKAAQAKDSVFVYKPVISRKAWLILAISGIALFAYLFLGFAPEGQGVDLYGYKLNIDMSVIKGIFSKFALSFTLTPILKTSLMALVFFTFFNLIIFELRSRSLLK
jgi:hypothetical protein